MFISKLTHLLHIIHRGRIEASLILLGIIWNVPISVIVGILIVLFKWFITMDHIDSSLPVFKKSESTNHSLEYVNNIPTLTLKSPTSYRNGFTHGQLFYSYIKQLHYRVLFLSLFKSFPNQNHLTIPQHITEELQGLVDGYNSHDPLIRLTYTVALNWHMLPMACTTAIDKSNGYLVFARNMDWVPYGNLARYSIIIHHQETGVSSFSIPGLIGTITGWNNKGLILAMNVCNTFTTRGTPAVFHNRFILEKYTFVHGVKKNLKYDPSPYGAYHLTLLDKQANGMVISYYQGPHSSRINSHYVRFLSDTQELITYNETYSDGNRIPLSGGRFFTSSRMQLKKENPLTPIRQLFEMYPINNWITCHSLFFYPNQNLVYIGFDNGFAATSKLHPYPMYITPVRNEQETHPE